MDKCEFCPLRDMQEDCYGAMARICFHLNPNDPRYNQAYNDVIVRQSMVEAGKQEFVPPDPQTAPQWLREALSLDVQKITEPPLWKKAVNFSKAVAKHAANGFVQAPEEVRRARLAVCANCPFLSPDRTCLKCGCPVDTKAAWASEKCPIDKWGGESSRPSGCGCGGSPPA